MDQITVITITRKRPYSLQRCMQSVEKQDIFPKPKHLIIVDDCLETKQFIEKCDSDVLYAFFEREEKEVTGVSRLAYLRNEAVKLIDTNWITFLDDDNEYKKEHLRLLQLTVLKNKTLLGYSWREFYCSDGTPYLHMVYPWSKNLIEGEKKFQSLLEEGVFELNSNIAKDRADTKDVKNPVRTVDANCWIINMRVFESISFCMQYTKEEIDEMVGDDDKFLNDVIENDFQLTCSKHATVKYYLGGFSNKDRGVYAIH